MSKLKLHIWPIPFLEMYPTDKCTCMQSDVVKGLFTAALFIKSGGGGVDKQET